ncbi:MAG: collagen-like protein, partial [Rhodospirillales bacterium]|nr:collagen-like protein [Rhodospirillales bacterium]
MPTISQLPRADLVDPADLVPLSHQGEARGISVGDLLSGTQPAIFARSSTLLGRTSIGPGGPEEVDVGPGLVLSEGTLTADHASFPTHQSFTPQDLLVLSTAGQPALLP